MNEQAWLADRFEENRTHLRAVAFRMLGSPSEADDAVQEAWLRLSRSDTSGVENLGGWLTTVVARVCLNMLRSRESRREAPLDAHAPERIVSREAGIDPEHEALVADSVGLALLVVLETLAPAERVAFVLHDLFAVPFNEIAPIVGRSPTTARQLASRARRRIGGAGAVPDADRTPQREVVDAFLAASRGGDFDASRVARPGRGDPSRPRSRARGRTEGGAWCGRRGRYLLRPGAIGTTGDRERNRRCRLGSGRNLRQVDLTHAALPQS